MSCLELNWFFYDPSWMLHLSEFVWALRSSVWVIFNNFLLIDSTDRSKISSDQKRLFIAVSLYPLTFFAYTPFKGSPNIKLMFPVTKIYFYFLLFSLNLWDESWIMGSRELRFSLNLCDLNQESKRTQINLLSVSSLWQSTGPLERDCKRNFKCTLHANMEMPD